jgi:hypothetical protein
MLVRHSRSAILLIVAPFVLLGHAARSSAQIATTTDTPACLTIANVVQRTQERYGYDVKQIHGAIDLFFEACRGADDQIAIADKKQRLIALLGVAERRAAQDNALRPDVDTTEASLAEVGGESAGRLTDQVRHTEQLRQQLVCGVGISLCCPSVDPSFPWTLDELIGIAEQQNPQAIWWIRQVSAAAANVRRLELELQSCEQKHLQIIHKHHCERIAAELQAARGALQAALAGQAAFLQELRLQITQEFLTLNHLDAGLRELASVSAEQTASLVDRALAQYGQGQVDIEVVLTKLNRHDRLFRKRNELRSERNTNVYRLRVLAGIPPDAN